MAAVLAGVSLEGILGVREREGALVGIFMLRCLDTE